MLQQANEMGTNNNIANVNRGGKTKWTSLSTSKLISTYKRLKATEEKDVRLWEHIQSEMEKSGFSYTISECKMKWGQLLKTYHENKGKKSKWLHFKDMDEIYQSKGDTKENKTKITFYFKTKKIPSQSSQ